MTGYVHIYTGDGKGKTTAALGLLLRARGAGLRVYVAQFLKASATSEIKALQARLPEVKVERFGGRHFVMGRPTPRDIQRAQKGLARLRRAVLGGAYDLVIADEINVAVKMGLIAVQDVLALLDARPAGVELVLTGRGADRRLVRRADLVTEMRNLKHYFDRGVRARRGIEW